MTDKEKLELIKQIAQNIQNNVGDIKNIPIENMKFYLVETLSRIEHIINVVNYKE